MGPRAGNAGAAPRTAFSLKEDAGIAELTFDLPGEKLNLLRGAVMEELAGVLSALSGRRDVRCLLIRSGKPGSFIAGADIREIEALRDARVAEEKSKSGQEVFNLLEDLPFPTVAVIDGAAVGGGLELALACTWRLVSDNPKTQIGLPETSLGIVPGFGGSWRLPRAVGLVQALTMILSARSVDGPRAAKIGLAHACYPAAFLHDRARELAARLAAGEKGLPRKRRRKGGFARWLAEGNPLGRALVFRTARRDVDARGGRHYPALQETLTLLQKTAHARPQAGPRSRAPGPRPDGFFPGLPQPRGHLFCAGGRASPARGSRGAVNAPRCLPGGGDRGRGHGRKDRLAVRPP